MHRDELFTGKNHSGKFNGKFASKFSDIYRFSVEINFNSPKSKKIFFLKNCPKNGSSMSLTTNIYYLEKINIFGEKINFRKNEKFWE